MQMGLKVTGKPDSIDTIKKCNVYGCAPDKTSGDKTSGAIKRPVTKRLSQNVWSYKTSGVKMSGAMKCLEL